MADCSPRAIPGAGAGRGPPGTQSRPTPAAAVTGKFTPAENTALHDDGLTIGGALDALGDVDLGQPSFQG